MKKLNPVVTEERESESRLFKFNSRIWNLQTNVCLMQEAIINLFITLIFPKSKAFLCNLDRKNRSVLTEKAEFECRDESTLIVLLEDLDYQDYNAKINVVRFSRKSFSAGVNYSIVHLREDNKPVDLDKYEFENRKKILLIARIEFFGCQQSNARTKMHGFLTECSSKSKNFLEEELDG